MSGALAGDLAGLMTAEAYPHAVGRIELVQTHISWVLLTGEYAYKIKRPVRYAFVDLTSFEQRARLCAEELRLNRRFAPDLYIDVCPVTLRAGVARIGGSGEIIEHAVKMRQFAREEMLDRLLEAGRIEPRELREFGADLARIHADLPVARASDPWGAPERVSTVLLGNLRETGEALARLPARLSVADLQSAMEARLAATASLIASRKAAGKVRECHGDLHSRNVVRFGGRLVAFDCLEFEPAFRWIDVADEIAFLYADLRSEGGAAHAYEFLSGYLAATGDYEACRLIALYAAHRMVVRAKVTALTAADAGDEASRSQLQQQAAAYVQRAREELAERERILVLMSGLSGSGKTWLARRLGPRLEAIHLRSDVERKRLAGLPESGRTGSGIGEGLYSAAASAQVYEHLAQSAAHVLLGGFCAIVDATFLRRSDRTRFAQLAKDLGVPALLVQCEAPPSVLRERIEEREREGTDASEAGMDVLRWQLANAEPVGSDEGLRILRVETTRSDMLEELIREIEAVGDAGPAGSQ